MKEWLSGFVGESAANIVGFILIFAIILGGIFVVLSIIRRFGGGSFATNGRSRQPRLSVMDAAAVDNRRKLVLIRRDDVEHLLLIGGPTDVVVEQNIVMESRAHQRVPSSRIEPEHIERFRQHEASITVEKSERPALSLHTQPAAAETNEAIQLNSPIETPGYDKRERESEQFRTPPSQPPAAPPAPVPPAPPRPQTQATPIPQPQPRQTTPSYPPQPRTVMPPQPMQPQSQAQVPRSHPAYPLSQVSRGVVSSTSGVVAGTVAATAATGSLGNIVPDREPAISRRSEAPELASPAVSVSEAPKFSSPVETAPVPATSDDDLEDLGGALHDAIMADLEVETSTTETTKEPENAEAELFESELLSSLNISATDASTDKASKDNIEDEMEKLLGELTRDETRNR